MTRTKDVYAAEDRVKQTDAAALLQVDRSTIYQWVKSNHIHAHKTPGGHQRIYAKDLARFAKQQGMPIPHPLKSLVATRVLWVTASADRQVDVAHAAADFHDNLVLSFVDSLPRALVAVGAFAPHVLVIDDVSSDVLAPAVAIAAARDFATRLRVLCVSAFALKDAGTTPPTAPLAAILNAVAQPND